jgi:cell division protein FtsQ
MRLPRSSRRFPRLSPRVVAALAVALVLLVGGWLWLRDSSLVAVKRVTVVGASGPEAAQIRSALLAAARGMTTLDVQVSKLRRAVSRYPMVKDLEVSTQFPHGMKVRVVEQIPVAAIVAGSRRVAAAGDGTLLRGVRASPSLPQVSVRSLPRGSKLQDRGALAAVSVLGAAPYQLLAHVSAAVENPVHGVVVELRHGPNLYFGDPTLLSSKWIAAAGVLADSGSAGASYIDVVDPERPAAGSSDAAGPSAASGSPPAAGSSATSAVSQVAGAAPAGSPTAAQGSLTSATASSTPGGG